VRQFSLISSDALACCREALVSVDRVLEILKGELKLTMGNRGTKKVSERNATAGAMPVPSIWPNFRIRLTSALTWHFGNCFAAFSIELRQEPHLLSHRGRSAERDRQRRLRSSSSVVSSDEDGKGATGALTRTQSSLRFY
jgi:hypothetical protein